MYNARYSTRYRIIQDVVWHMVIFKCPWCGIGKKGLNVMKYHIKETHECRDHHTYWLSDNDRL